MVTTLQHLPLLDQIQDCPLGKKGAEVWSPPRDARMWQIYRGWHRYTRWTGRLSHKTSNLSHPHNWLLKGCDLCFTQYQVQGKKVVIYLAIIKQLSHTNWGFPRKVWVHAFWQTCHTIHSGYSLLLERHWDSWSRGSVACNRPKCLVPEYPDNSPEVQ